MQLGTRLITALFLLATSHLPTTTAAPASPHHPQTSNISARDTCTHIFPTPSTTRITLLNPPSSEHLPPQPVLLTFIIPPSSPPTTTSSSSPIQHPPAGPCTLRARFPPHWSVFDSRIQSGGPPLSTDIYAVDGPAPGALVGTVQFGAGSDSAASAGESSAERVVVVNSFACRESMTFRLQLSDREGEGEAEVGFVEGWDEGLAVDGGLEVVSGC